MKNKILWGLLLLAVVFISIIVVGNFTVIDLGDGETEKLDFCNTEQECIDYLESVDPPLPNNFLEENNIKIECDRGDCYASK